MDSRMASRNQGKGIKLNRVFSGSQKPLFQGKVSYLVEGNLPPKNSFYNMLWTDVTDHNTEN